MADAAILHAHTDQLRRTRVGTTAHDDELVEPAGDCSSHKDLRRGRRERTPGATQPALGKRRILTHRDFGVRRGRERSGWVFDPRRLGKRCGPCDQNPHLLSSSHREYGSREGGNHEGSLVPAPTHPSLVSTLNFSRAGALGLLSILLCAIAIGAVNLSALQMVSSRLGSYTPAALTVASFSVGNAAGLVLQGRLLDRLSPAVVALPASAIFAAALLAVTLTDSRSAATYLVLFTLAGLSLPAVTGIVRAAVPDLYPQGHQLRMYAVIAVTFQAGIACGPMLAAAFSPHRSSGLVFVVIAGLAVCATGLVARFRTSRTRKASRLKAQFEPPVLDSRRPALLTSGYITVLVATTGFGITTGVVTTTVPAQLEATGSSLVGAAFTALALGDLVSGLLYGRSAKPSALPVHLRLSLASAALASMMLALASGNPLLAVVMMFVLGAVGTPAGIACSALLDVVVPHQRLTAAFTTMVATNLVAISVGSSLGGVLIDEVGSKTAMLIAPASLVIAVAVVATRRRSISGQL